MLPHPPALISMICRAETYRSYNANNADWNLLRATRHGASNWKCAPLLGKNSPEDLIRPSRGKYTVHTSSVDLLYSTPLMLLYIRLTVVVFLHAEDTHTEVI